MTFVLAHGRLQIRLLTMLWSLVKKYYINTFKQELGADKTYEHNVFETGLSVLYGCYASFVC